MQNSIPLPEEVESLLPMSDITAAMWDLLGISVENLIINAWQKHKQIVDAEAATAGRPGSRRVVEIKSHTLRSTHRPKLEIVVGQEVVHTIPFEFTLVLRIESLVVTVSNGGVLSIGPGDATAEVVLKANGSTLVEKKLTRAALPESILP
jgi:hypothetical protein